ncbi:uncharacterized protein LOC115928560 [Strongylocentrotus purpuratus]|uniref:Uncharacterized protein n=1 Tax=Strongylocentrotus purpuratus TaxID=7668 RepID=A0A7M7PJN7_STRPU|nr:uncharacterized protein LOC115928560 [Strongylocentrotus purpuratus]
MAWKKISLSFAGVFFVLASLASGFPVHRGWSDWSEWPDYFQTLLPALADALIGVGPTDPVHEASPSWSSLVEPSEKSPFSFVESSSFESHVRPIEVIQTTAKAPEESPVPMFEDLARLVEVIQTPAEVENHSGLLGSAGGNGNITYENVPYTIIKQLIHVDSSGGHTRISTA